MRTTKAVEGVHGPHCQFAKHRLEIHAMQTQALHVTTHGQEQIAIGIGPAKDVKIEKG